MIEQLAPLIALTQGWLWLAFLVFLRVGAMASVAPGFGQSYIPMRVKLAVAFVLTMAVFPSVSPQLQAQFPSFAQLVKLILSETVVGLFFGLVLRFFVMALQTAGAIAAQSTSLSQIFGGSAGADPAPAMGHLLVAAGLGLMAIMGLHVQMVRYIAHSYDMVPVGSSLFSQAFVELGVAEVSRSFAIAFRLAAPFLLASTLYNVTLGVINRAMPQLMVFFIGAPAVTAGGFILMLLCAPILLGVWVNELGMFMALPFEGAP